MSNRNNNNNRRYNNSHNNGNYNRQNNKKNNKSNDEHRYDSSKRTIESLLSFDDNIEYEEDVRARQQNQNNNNNSGSNTNNNNKKNSGKIRGEDRYNDRDVSNNILKEVITDNEFCDKAEMLDDLTTKNGLIDMLQDIRNCNKKNMKLPYYVNEIFKNPAFAAALVEVLDEYYNKKDPLGRVLIDKKDMNILLDRMIYFYEYGPKYKNQKYVRAEAIDYCMKTYHSLILKYSKKKINKLRKELPKMPKEVAKLIAAITAGGNIRTIYALIDYFYIDAKEFKFSEKAIRTIFKICYPKVEKRELVKALMLEKRPNGDPIYRGGRSHEADVVWSKVDKIMRDELEKFSVEEIESLIREYIDIRKKTERKYRAPRRFGNRKAYHPDDFHKIVSTCEKIEAEDRSLLPWLRH